MPLKFAHMDCTDLQLPWSPMSFVFAPTGSSVNDSLRTLSWDVLEACPPCLFESIFVRSDYRPSDVMITSTLPTQRLLRVKQVGGLHAAVLRLQLAVLVIRADTNGRVTTLPSGVWKDLLTLAEPHIRVGIYSSGCPISEYEDCYQEAWLAILGKIHLVDPDPDRGSLGCWLRAIARRTASRFLRRRNRNARIQGQSSLSSAQIPDPHLVDPASQYVTVEAATALAVSLELLRTHVGEDAYRLVNQYLADPSGLTGLPLRTDLGAGRFWHLWRKTKKFLRAQLVSPEK